MGPGRRHQRPAGHPMGRHPTTPGSPSRTEKGARWLRRGTRSRPGPVRMALSRLWLVPSSPGGICDTGGMPWDEGWSRHEQGRLRRQRAGLRPAQRQFSPRAGGGPGEADSAGPRRVGAGTRHRGRVGPEHGLRPGAPTRGTRVRPGTQHRDEGAGPDEGRRAPGVVRPGHDPPRGLRRRSPA